MAKIIAFGHRKRTGKDTALKFAFSHLRLNYRNVCSTRLSFGDQLKGVAVEMFGWAELQDAVYYSNHPELIEIPLPSVGLTPRQIWDELGSFGARLCPMIWPEMAFRKTRGDLFLVPDLRRPVEVEYIKSQGGMCYRIDRDLAPVSNHEVDTALASFDGWDGIIKNNGTLKDLNFQIKALIDQNMIRWGMA